MGAIASRITSRTIVYSTVYSGTDQRKHQRSASLAFVRAIHRGPVNNPHKWPVTRKMFPFDDVIMISCRKLWMQFLIHVIILVNLCKIKGTLGLQGYILISDDPKSSRHNCIIWPWLFHLITFVFNTMGIDSLSTHHQGWNISFKWNRHRPHIHHAHEQIMGFDNVISSSSSSSKFYFQQNTTIKQ